MQSARRGRTTCAPEARDDERLERNHAGEQNNRGGRRENDAAVQRDFPLELDNRGGGEEAAHKGGKSGFDHACRMQLPVRGVNRLLRSPGGAQRAVFQPLELLLEDVRHLGDVLELPDGKEGLDQLLDLGIVPKLGKLRG